MEFNIHFEKYSRFHIPIANIIVNNRNCHIVAMGLLKPKQQQQKNASLFEKLCLWTMLFNERATENSSRVPNLSIK